MQAALEQNAGAAQLEHLLDLFVNFFERQDVALFVSNGAVKRAKRTIFGAEIGVIDVAIDLVGSHARIVLLHAEGVRLHADPDEIVGLQHLDGLQLGQSHNGPLDTAPILSVLSAREILPEMGIDPPLPLFLRKNVILNGLCVNIVQECESKGVTGEFGLGAWDLAGAEVSRDNTQNVTIDAAIMSR